MGLALREHLDWLTGLPWGKVTEETFDLAAAKASITRPLRVWPWRQLTCAREPPRVRHSAFWTRITTACRT